VPRQMNILWNGWMTLHIHRRRVHRRSGGRFRVLNNCILFPSFFFGAHNEFVSTDNLAHQSRNDSLLGFLA
jgi:hypothetical protein